MSLRTITGTILNAAGDPVAGAPVSFSMIDRVYLLDPDETYVPSAVSTRTDSNGDFSVEVAAGLPTLWQVKLPGNDNFVVSIPEGATTTIEELRATYNGQPPERVPGDPPIVTDFTNMQHPHTSAATGGSLPDAALGSGTAATEKVLDGTRAWKYPQRFDARNSGDLGSNGTTNHTTINAAISAAFTAGGGMVVLPLGEFPLAGALTMRTNVLLVGAGIGATVLQMDSGTAGNVIEASGADHFSIQNLTIDQNHGGGGTSGGGINLTACTDFVISGVEVKNTSNNGILIDTGCSDFTITGCLLDTIGNQSATGSGMHGIATSGGASGGVYRGTITGNRIYNHMGSAINLSDAHHCTATGNTGWRDTSDDQGYGGIRFSNSTTFCTATGNTFYRPSRGIFFASTAGLGNVAANNTILEAELAGCLIEAPFAHLVGNVFYNCLTGGASEGCVRLADTAVLCKVSGNTIIDDRTPKLHQYGIRDTSTTGTNDLRNNHIVGFLSAAYAVSGATTLVDGLIGLNGSVVVNEEGVDQDFRVESVDRTFMFMVDAGLNSVGIGTSSFGNLTNWTNTICTFNSAGSDMDVRMLGDNDGNLFRLDASVDQIGIGTATPNTKLTVNGGIAIVDGMAAPSATSGFAKLYVDSADGDLKVIFGDGTVKTIVVDT